MPGVILNCKEQFTDARMLLASPLLAVRMPALMFAAGAGAGGPEVQKRFGHGCGFAGGCASSRS